MKRSWLLRWSLPVLVALLALASGCGGLRVQFQVRRDAVAYQTLKPGQGLSAGERFSVHVQLPSAGYVYVTRSQPGAATQALYPLGPAVRLPSGGPQRIPTDGSDLIVPALQRDEQLCLIISETPVLGDLPHCLPTARIQRLYARTAPSSAAQGSSAPGPRDEKSGPPTPSENKPADSKNQSKSESKPSDEKKPPQGEGQPGAIGPDSRPSQQPPPKGEGQPGTIGKGNRPSETQENKDKANSDFDNSPYSSSSQGTMVVPIPLSACRTPGPDSRKRALLVGIDHYIPAPSGVPRARDLRGAYNDVRSVRSLLQRRYGFRDDEICELRDEDATRETIVGTIRSFLIERTQMGDQVFWFYAGHGSEASNPWPGEEHRPDQTIVPSDANLNVPDVRDKELRYLFSQVLDRGGKLVALFDSCHSGSITMGSGSERGRHPRDRDEDLDLRFRFAAPSQVLPPLAPPLPQPLHERGALILTATQSDQKSQERMIRGVSHGVFTAALEEALKNEAIEPSVAQLRDNIEAHMRIWTRVERQTPGYAASAARQGQTLFGDAAAKGRYVTVKNVQGSDVHVSGGLILGLDEGTVLEGLTQPAMELRVTRVLDLTNSLASLASQPEVRPSVGDLFRVRTMRAAERPILGIWLGEIGPEPAELEAAGVFLFGLQQHGFFQWAVGEKNATHRLRYHAGEWQLLSAERSQAQALGAQLAMAPLQSVLPRHARLFVEWPLNLSEHELLRRDLPSIGARVLYAEGQKVSADYVLRGSLSDGVRFTLEQEPGHRRPNMPVQTKPSHALDIVSSAELLVRQHLWLTLPNPGDAYQGFPYRMRLVSLDNPQRELLSGGQTHTGETYYLHLSRDRRIANSANQRRFVYLCAVSSQGGMTLLYPLSQGDQENSLPDGPDGPHEIPLNGREQSPFCASGDASIDTYIMLTSEEALGNAGQLCSVDQRLNSRSSRLPMPQRWSVQRIEVHHDPHGPPCPLPDRSRK